MKQMDLKIIDPVGLHARPASITVKAASQFESDIKISIGDKSGNLKSIMNVMALGIKKGDTFTISAEGPDEVDALEAIIKAMKENNLV